MKRLARTPLAQQVYESVRQAVVDGDMRPEEDISEVHLAHVLGVSRTPVREAIGRLETEGFVVRRGDGLVVPALSHGECLDLYAVRERLEGLAAGEAAERAGEEQVARLRAINQEIADLYAAVKGVASDGKSAALIVAGASFHQQVVLASGNGKNAELLGNLMYHVARYRKVGMIEGRDMYLDDHSEVVEAIASRDADAAEAAMRVHVRHARDHVAQRFAEGAQEPPA